MKDGSLPRGTHRLRFRPWTVEDLPVARALWGDPEVIRFIDSRDRLDDDAVRARLDDELRCLHEHGVQYWVVERTEDGGVVGCAGLRPSGRDDAPWELGVHVLRAEWGRGYASEAARDVLAFAFGPLGATAVFAGHHPDNAASARLLEKLAFARAGEDLYPPTGRMHPSWIRRSPRAVGAAAAYDLVADAYAEKLASELDGKPFDRGWLAALASRHRDGPVLDLGCGPGHVTRFLADAGVAEVVGADRSGGMLEQARAAHPDLPFVLGDFAAPDRVSDGRLWSAVLLMYAIVNLPAARLEGVFRCLAEVVRPGGEVAISFHVGGRVVPVDEWWGHEVLVDFVFHDPEAVEAALGAAGWTAIQRREREPYGEDVEYPSRRAYITARRRSKATATATPTTQGASM